MLNIDQCMIANRPLMFVVAESDMEVLQHLRKNYKENTFFVYSSTFLTTFRLEDVLDRKFHIDTRKVQATGTVEVLTNIQLREFPKNNTRFETYIFLDCQSYVHDAQVVRKIKDIVARYQLDEKFTVNMIFISQTVGVPMALERLSEVVFFDLPDEEKLVEMSDHLTVRLNFAELNEKGEPKRNKQGKLIVKEGGPSEEVVNNLKGMTLYEVEQAYLQSYYSYKRIDVDFIRNFKKSAIAKTDLLSLLETDVTFKDIGGLETLKQWVYKSYGGWTVKGKEFGLPLLKGLLMVGLPGCGKSLISKALGNQWQLPVVQFDPSRIFSSRVGDSETNMRRVLQIVENISPVVMFIDEVEKGLAGMQSSTFSDSGVTARVIGTFLNWMQECKKPVFVVATANAIQFLPPELIGRFDETFFVNMPQEAERKEIFEIHIKKLSRDPKNFDLDKLAADSTDLSGREIEQTLREAMYDAFYQNKEMTTDVIRSVLRKKTSLVTTMAEQLDYLLKWVGFDEDRQDGIRARYASRVDTGEKKRVQSEIEKMLGDIEKGAGKKDA